MLVECHNCANRWDYSGDKPVGAETNCPECAYKTAITPVDPAAVFDERAPLLSSEELARLLLEDVVADEIYENVRAIHVYGSFVNPDARIDYDETLEEDAHPSDLSDLDVWVEWTYDRTVATRYRARQHGVICRLITQDELSYPGGEELTKIPIDAAGEAPDGAVATIEAAERIVFALTELDRETLGFRPLELTLGNKEAFDNEVGDDPSLTIWEREVES